MDLAIAASNEPDKLVDQLQFALPKPAVYARERRLVQIMPSGSNTFSPNGTQVMTFNVTSYDGRLDPAYISAASTLPRRRWGRPWLPTISLQLAAVIASSASCAF